MNLQAVMANGEISVPKSLPESSREDHMHIVNRQYRWLLNFKLFHQDHFFGGAVASGFETEVIHSAGYKFATVVGTIPVQIIQSFFSGTDIEILHQLTLLVIYAYHGGSSFVHVELDGGVGIKGIGIVTDESDTGWGNHRVTI